MHSHVHHDVTSYFPVRNQATTDVIDRLAPGARIVMCGVQAPTLLPQLLQRGINDVLIVVRPGGADLPSAPHVEHSTLGNDIGECATSSQLEHLSAC